MCGLMEIGDKAKYGYLIIGKMGENAYPTRIAAWKQTQEVAHTLVLTVPDSVRLTPADILTPHSSDYNTSVRVYDDDCLDIACKMKQRGLHPAVLNMCDDRMAGGCVDTGSGAQEETLWRRTALCVTQKQEFYPLQRALIYSPEVPVLRKSEKYNYEWIIPPETVDFISCPAIKYPVCEWITTADGVRFKELTVRDKMELSRRLRMILSTACQMGNDSVVLGPMGCGAWRNPPHSVARVFAEVLPEYMGIFKEIVIAALTTARSAAEDAATNAEIFALYLDDTTSTPTAYH
jgi:uncharacterized protein (TIGR02452 family)